MPAGVQGTSPGRWVERKPTLTGMEAVHVLGRVHRHQDFLGINLRRQRKLHQDAVNFVAPVQLQDQVQQLLGRNRVRRGKLFAVDAHFLAAFHFAANIDFRGRVVPDQNDGQSGTHAGRRHVLYLGSNFRPDFGGDLVAVQNRGSHEVPPPEKLYRKLSRKKELHRSCQLSALISRQ